MEFDEQSNNDSLRTRTGVIIYNRAIERSSKERVFGNICINQASGCFVTKLRSTFEVETANDMTKIDICIPEIFIIK